MTNGNPYESHVDLIGKMKKKLSDLRIQKIFQEPTPLWGCWNKGREFEENIDCHAVDPEEEGEKGVEDEVSNSNTKTELL